MEAKLLSCESISNIISDEDFIDMEVSSFSTFFSGSVASPPRNREFEFKMETELTTSPADELFYKGKLLPLHLPPVEKLLRNSTYRSKDVDFDELYATLTTPTAAATPYESCNISPIESRQASRELNAEDYFSEYYPAGLNLSSASLAALTNPPHVGAGVHRRSFSLAIMRNSVNKILSSSSSSSSSSCSSSSSSVSNNANGSHRVQFLKRSGSVNSEMENSIQGAIAHCKRSAVILFEKNC